MIWQFLRPSAIVSIQLTQGVIEFLPTGVELCHRISMLLARFMHLLQDRVNRYALPVRLAQPYRNDFMLSIYFNFQMQSPISSFQ